MEIHHELHDISLAMTSEVNILISGGDTVTRTALARLIHQPHGPAESFFVFSVRPESDPGPTQAMTCASNGGTLFVEELAELDTDRQQELLRVVDARRAGTEGAPRLVIAATGDDLQGRLASEPILATLFYRLNSIHLVVVADVHPATTWLM